MNEAPPASATVSEAALCITESSSSSCDKEAIWPPTDASSIDQLPFSHRQVAPNVHQVIERFVHGPLGLVEGKKKKRKRRRKKRRRKRRTGKKKKMK